MTGVQTCALPISSFLAPQSQPAEQPPENPPPPYSPGLKSPGAAALAAAVANKPKPKPPPAIKPKPSRLSGAPAAETVTALYEYAATQEGDLSFKAGDVITIVNRTPNPNEWWTGKLNGKTGQFPGNYVQLGG